MRARPTPGIGVFDGLRAVVPERLRVPLNALSVDLEDWYQVLYFEGHIPREAWAAQESRLEAATGRLLDLLEVHGTRATFFVLAWNAERMPWLVEAIRRRGHEIASHGYGHHLVHRQGPAAFAEDLARSLQILRMISGEPVRGYRAPSFSITRESAWALSALMEQGVEYDSSVLPVRRAYGGIPGAPRAPWVLRDGAGRSLVELPPSTLRILGRPVPFSGGGYFRLFPYAVVRRGLRHLNRAGLPGVVYLHPWELDPGHPVVPVRWEHRFQHYVNLQRTEAKLRRLLEDFRFVPMVDLMAAVRSACGEQDDPGGRRPRPLDAFLDEVWR